MNWVIELKKLILIKYGELTTKKGNRNQFINCLSNNTKNVEIYSTFRFYNK